MAKAGTNAGGMNPLQRLILDRMRERGWTPQDVEARGVTHATLHRYMNPLQLKTLPRQQVLASLAQALELPVEKVRAAAFAAIAGTPAAEVTEVAGDTPEWARLLIDVGRELGPEERDQWLALAVELSNAYKPKRKGRK